MSPFSLDVGLFLCVICLVLLFHFLLSLFLKTFSAFFPMAVPILSPKSCKGSEKACAQLLLYSKKVETL